MKHTEQAASGQVFLSCQKDVHYSREVVLAQHALVHIFAGTLEITYANHTIVFGAGETVLIPRNQVGRLAKRPAADAPFQSASILFPEGLLRKYYAAHPVAEILAYDARHRALAGHPLLESLFNSLLPYFAMHETLPPVIAEAKILEALAVLQVIDQTASRLLGSFQEPGRLDLATFMEQHFMYNFPLEKFAYLTGRSLTTFKKDFKTLFDVPPGRWLVVKRLELAHYQIAVQKKRPSEVYLAAGFENLSHFSYVFKRQFGYSPANSPTDTEAGLLSAVPTVLAANSF